MVPATFPSRWNGQRKSGTAVYTSYRAKLQAAVRRCRTPYRYAVKYLQQFVEWSENDI